MSEWQPIETAPRDGSWIAAWRNHATREIQVRWDAAYGEWEDDYGHHVYNVTHWAPLKKPPHDRGEK